jgi:hypothetical protein
MSLARLSNGKFLVIDAVPLTPTIKKEIDQLTENGSKIEAFLATHPFHTLSIPAFHQAYPEPKYYGCPRHLRKLTTINWSGDLNDCKTRSLWEPEVEMRIPAGMSRLFEILSQKVDITKTRITCRLECRVDIDLQYLGSRRLYCQLHILIYKLFLSL